MTRIELGVLLVFLLVIVTVGGAAQEGFHTTGLVQKQETFDHKGTQFYTFVTPEGELLLSGQGQKEVFVYLNNQVGKKVRITIEPIELEKIER